VGLANIWKLPEGTEHPSIKVNLCGGMFSGPGKDVCTSFRGKVYHDFLEALSGVSLYQDVISGPQIKEILTSLLEFKQQLEAHPPGYKLVLLIDDKVGVHQEGMEDLDDLITMFSKYSKIEGAELVAWY